MAQLFPFRVLRVVMALVVVSAAAVVPMAPAAPLSEGTTASGGTVSQSGDCPGERQQDEHCLPGGPESPAGSDSSPSQPVTPPARPPVTRPIEPPPGIPRGTQHQDTEFPFAIIGVASAKLHIHDDDQDITYTSNRVKLVFVRRIGIVQEMPGNTQYVLTPDKDRDSMIWNVTGRVFDCTVEGKAFIWFPFEQFHEDSYFPPGLFYPLDPSRPAFGYLNVVGPDGGDFHSVIIQMFDPDARLTKTCPGNPPLVTREKFDAGFLLHILWQKNTREDGRIIFQGQQTYDQGNPSDFLNLLPPGPNQDIARHFLRQGETSGSGTSFRYTWTWELFPVSPSDWYR